AQPETAAERWLYPSGESPRIRRFRTLVSRPLTAQRFRNGKHTFTIEAQGQKKEFRLPALRLGYWDDFVFRVRYSTGNDGLAEVEGGKILNNLVLGNEGLPGCSCVIERGCHWRIMNCLAR